MIPESIKNKLTNFWMPTWLIAAVNSITNSVVFVSHFNLYLIYFLNATQDVQRAKKKWSNLWLQLYVTKYEVFVNGQAWCRMK